MNISDELEATAGDVIKLLGTTLVASALVRKLRRLAGDVRKLEQHTHVVLYDEQAEAPAADNVASLDHARRQKKITQLAERGSK
ncbi:MAG TPA: hypothetical protein VGF92_02865 [Stellaceae bacterium]|jgi:hypothetical protein